MREGASVLTAPTRRSVRRTPPPCEEPHPTTITKTIFVPKIEEPHLTPIKFWLRSKSETNAAKHLRRAFAGDSDNGNAKQSGRVKQLNN